MVPSAPIFWALLCCDVSASLPSVPVEHACVSVLIVVSICILPFTINGLIKCMIMIILLP
jgi:hypothetical protein